MGGLYARRTERISLPLDGSNGPESARCIHGRVREGVIHVERQLHCRTTFEWALWRFDADDPRLLHVLVQHARTCVLLPIVSELELERDDADVVIRHLTLDERGGDPVNNPG